MLRLSNTSLRNNFKAGLVIVKGRMLPKPPLIIRIMQPEIIIISRLRLKQKAVVMRMGMMKKTRME